MRTGTGISTFLPGLVTGIESGKKKHGGSLGLLSELEADLKLSYRKEHR